jgi:transposase
MQKAKGKVKGPKMIHEIRRLSELGLSQRKIAGALGISRNTVIKYQQEVSGSENQKPVYSAPWSSNVDWTKVKSETELGVSLYHYWEESIDAEKEGVKIPYSSFWREFKRRYPSIPIDFHKTHPPGERCEVDFKGETRGLGYIDSLTKDFVACRLFGSILCFSQLLYIRVTPNEKQEWFLSSVARSFEYFKGIPSTVAVDNAKAQVTSAHRYDADINPEFFKFANHYNVAPLAMRPGQPKDKNLIENALGVFWRWIGPKIRKKTFFSIGEINEYVLTQLEIFNNRIQRKYGTSRREKFLVGEKNKLQDLPPTAFENGEWKKSKVHPDSHIQITYNFYSVPYQHVGKTLDVRITGSSIEVFCDLDRIAIHRRRGGAQRGLYTTVNNHLPQKHLAVKEQTPKNTLNAAEEIGVATLQVVKNLLISEKHHPFTYLRRCQGIIRLAKRYTANELEIACKTVLSFHKEKPRLKDLEGIISYNRAGEKQKPIIRQPNANLRGQESWRNNLN